MITHKDYDAGKEASIEWKLPEKVELIEVCHDGGRLSVYVNGVEVFNHNMTGLGVRDCQVSLDGK